MLLALCFTPLVLCAEPADPKESTELKEKLEEAIEAQQFGEEVTQDVKAKIIKEAPVGVLPSGTGDVSTTGEPREQHCIDASSSSEYLKGLPVSRLASGAGSGWPLRPFSHTIHPLLPSQHHCLHSH